MNQMNKLYQCDDGGCSGVGGGIGDGGDNE